MYTGWVGWGNPEIRDWILTTKSEIVVLTKHFWPTLYFGTPDRLWGFFLGKTNESSHLIWLGRTGSLFNSQSFALIFVGTLHFRHVTKSDPRKGFGTPPVRNKTQFYCEKAGCKKMIHTKRVSTDLNLSWVWLSCIFHTCSNLIKRWVGVIRYQLLQYWFLWQEQEIYEYTSSVAF